jgi:hypothetical protein
LALQYVNCFGSDDLLNEDALRDKLGFRGISDGKLAKAEEVLRIEANKARLVCSEYRHRHDALVKRLCVETTVLGLTPEFLNTDAT